MMWITLKENGFCMNLQTLGHHGYFASDFADVDPRTVHLWTVRFNENDIGVLRVAPG